MEKARALRTPPGKTDDAQKALWWQRTCSGLFCLAVVFFFLRRETGDMRSGSLPTNAFTAVHVDKFLHMGVCHLGLTLFWGLLMRLAYVRRPTSSDLSHESDESCPTTVTNELCVSRILLLPCSLEGSSSLVIGALPGTPIWL